MSLDRTLQRVWYERAPFPLFLLLTPLAVVFALLSGARRLAYRSGLLQTIHVSRPVLVVGNISVGGTGKTPLVIRIAELLQARGCTVGIVTRGYGGGATQWPQVVTPTTSAEQVGDEAVLLSSRSRAVVVAGPDRVAAAQRAIAAGAQLIVSDDGLQHYALARDAEIAVIDAERGLGNGWLLPAGPLRERAARLQSVDLVVHTRRTGAAPPMHNNGGLTAMHELTHAINLVTGEHRTLASFMGSKVHAIAGIGNPQAFFRMLEQGGLDVDARELADHAQLTAQDVAFGGSAPVLMTEKDAVKCRSFAQGRHWAVPLSVRFDEADERKLTALLDTLLARSALSNLRRGES